MSRIVFIPQAVVTRMVPIPAQSVVRLVHADRHTPEWRKDLGRLFRVGYYGRMDGLDCIWLVNDEGEYEQTTSHEGLYRYFDVIHFTKDTNYYGRRRPRLPAILPAELANQIRTKRRVSR